MKPIYHVGRSAFVVVMVTCLLILVRCGSAQQTPDKPIYTTDPLEKTACMRRLNIIWGALQQYRKQHQDKLPDKLSELTPEFIHDPNDLTCPFVQKRGGLRTWKKQFTELSPDPYTSYSFEFAPVPLHYNLWRGLPKKTWRDLKMEMMKHLGEVVPIVRCHDHRPWLNLAYDGRIYETESLYWERNFVKNEHALLPSVLFAPPAASRAPAAMGFPARSPQANGRSLDLTGFYNGLLSNSWQGSPGNNLSGLAAGLHDFDGVQFDIRGVIQLGGEELPSIFPRNVDGIPVRQKCARIHFLHAVGFIYAFGTTNGHYTIHYADGEVLKIPVRYGQQIADWWFNRGIADRMDAKAVWTGENDAARAHERSIRLYRFTWENPRSNDEISTISLASSVDPDGPFVVAITVD
jgi:hypothetical protein